MAVFRNNLVRLMEVQYSGLLKLLHSSQLSSSFSFGVSTGSNPFAKTATTTVPLSSNTFTVSASPESKPSNLFASIKPSTAPAKPLFPPNSPFAKFPPAQTPSGFTPEMASQKPPPVQSTPTRRQVPCVLPVVQEESQHFSHELKYSKLHHNNLQSPWRHLNNAAEH